jgi:hypothetical protein
MAVRKFCDRCDRVIVAAGLHFSFKLVCLSFRHRDAGLLPRNVALAEANDDDIVSDLCEECAVSARRQFTLFMGDFRRPTTT